MSLQTALPFHLFHSFVHRECDDLVCCHNTDLRRLWNPMQADSAPMAAATKTKQKTETENNMLCQTTNARVGSCVVEAAATIVRHLLCKWIIIFRLDRSGQPHVRFNRVCAFFNWRMKLRPFFLLLLCQSVVEAFKVFRTTTFFATSHVKDFRYHTVVAYSSDKSGYRMATGSTRTTSDTISRTVFFFFFFFSYFAWV